MKTLNPKPSTPNPKTQNLNPEPYIYILVHVTDSNVATCDMA